MRHLVLTFSILALAVSCGAGCTPLKPGSDALDLGGGSGGGGVDAGCPDLFATSFEDGVQTWSTWANCPGDEKWYVDASGTPATNGGGRALRLHTSAFQDACAFPGVYAISPPQPATPGVEYRADALGRHGTNAGQTALMFYDSFELPKQLDANVIDWTADDGRYSADPTASGVAPPGTVSVRVRFGLNTANQNAEIDLVHIARSDGRCGAAQ